MRFDLAAWGAELTPDRPAIWFGGRWASYRDLNERATGLAHYLLASGLGYGDRVGLLAPNHIAHFDLLFAAAKIGVVPVAFDPDAPLDNLVAAARVAMPGLVISDPRCETRAAQAFSCSRIDLDEYRDVLSQASRRPLEAAALSPESIHSLQFGARFPGHATLVPYRQVHANVRATAVGWGLGPDDGVLQVSPCWRAQLQALAIPLLAVGGRVVIPDGFDTDEFLHVSEQLSVSLWSASTAQYEVLGQAAAFDAFSTESLRAAWVETDDPSPLELTARYAARGLVLKPAFVCAEAGFNVFELSDDDVREDPRILGQPLAHVEVRIERESGQPCADGEAGRLRIGGEGLSAGYLDSDAAWRARCPARHFDSGVIAWRDARGRIRRGDPG